MKRGIIIFVYVSVFLIAGIAVFFITRPKPSCTDGKRNQGESDIDCGGPCAACPEIPQTDPIVVKETFFVFGGPDRYDLGAKINNPNHRYGAKKVSYRFLLKDISGATIVERSGESYLLPAETKYLVENNVEAGQLPRTVELEIDSADWEDFSRFEEPQFRVFNPNYQVIGGDVYSEVTGIVRNESPIDFRSVDVNIILRDAEKKVVALASTNISSFISRQERGFRVFWPQRFSGDVTKVEIEPETNMFDPQNFIDVSFPGNSQ